MMSPIYRQGDVLLIPVGVMPDGAKKIRRVKRGVVLAEGEATGHAHRILDRGADLYELVPSGDVDEMRRRFLRVKKEAEVIHEEHATIMIMPGDYELIRQTEYTPERLRAVAD